MHNYDTFQSGADNFGGSIDPFVPVFYLAMDLYKQL